MNLSENRSLAHIRQEYTRRELLEETVDKNPFVQFGVWLDEAIASRLPEPTAMNLATVDSNSRPASRIVLLKAFNEKGFVFFSNYRSRKGQALENNQYAAINFFWPELERQVRVEGTVSLVTQEESKEYFNSRPRGSQIGAWASPQSQVIHKKDLEEKARELDLKWRGKEIPCPETWGGYNLTPDYFEFWQGRPNRLHDRITYIWENNEWLIRRIAP